MSSRFEYWRRRRRRRRRRIALLLLVTMTATAVTAYSHHDSHTHPSPGTGSSQRQHNPSATPHIPGRAAHTAGRRHPATSSRPAELATAGTGLAWASFHGIELPSSPQDGPRQVSHGRAWEFGDTPRGALLAAVNIGVRTAALWGPAIFAPTIDRQVAGPDSTALLKADFRDYGALRAAAHVRRGQPAGRGYAAQAGYRFAAYTPAVAAVEIATEGPGTSSGTVLAATRVDLVWQRGDWRVIAPPGGDWASSAAPISSLTGYTAFTQR